MKIAVLLLVMAPLHAAEVRCPDQWAPAGWIAQGSAPGARIRDAGIMVGPVETNGVLRGAERKIKGGYEVRFAGLNDYIEPLAKWMYCGYGKEARLLRKLPDATSECIARTAGAMTTVQCR